MDLSHRSGLFSKSLGSSSTSKAPLAAQKSNSGLIVVRKELAHQVIASPDSGRDCTPFQIYCAVEAGRVAGIVAAK